MKKFTSKSQKIGKIGEDLAVIYLKKHKFRILENNYTRKCGEIDIIAIKNGIFHFIEVKSSSFSYGGVSYETINPEENLHRRKSYRILRTIETYFIESRLGNVEWQFDLVVVFIDLNKKVSTVKIIENIVLE